MYAKYNSVAWLKWRSLFRCRLQSLFFLLTVVSVVLGIGMQRVYKMRTGIRTVEELGGCVRMNTECTESGDLEYGPFIPPKPVGRLNSWVAKIRNSSFFRSVYFVDLGRDTADKDLEILQHFPQLRQVDLRGTMVSDNCLKHLAALDSLRKVNLNCTKVTLIGIEWLAQKRPEILIDHEFIKSNPEFGDLIKIIEDINGEIIEYGC